MNKRSIFAALFAAALMGPLVVSAHERQVINIGGTDYIFVVGSLGEPVVVDDKTGVDLRVKIADPKDPTNASAAGAKPVTGLEATLKVEVSAGDKKKVMDLSPAWNDAGAYKNTFYPTVKTGFTYRFTGTVNNTPVDLSFTCAPEGSKAVEDKSEVSLGAGVKRVYKNGQFGCPLGKEELGFPEEGMTIMGLHEDLHGDMEKMAKDSENDPVKGQAGTALALSIVGLVLGSVALKKSRNKAQ